MEAPQLEIHNINTHIPYRQLPPFKSKMPNIYCQDFNHRNELVQFLNLRKSSDILKSRLHCRKCLAGPYAACSQDVVILEDLLQNNVNALKYTKLQGNVFQEFSDFYHSFQFDVDESDINLHFELIQEEFTYNLQECKKVVLKQHEEYRRLKERKFNNVLSQFEKTFNFSEQEKLLCEYSKLDKVPHPKEQQKVKESLDGYVEKFYTTEDNHLRQILNNLKKDLSEQKDQLVFHSHKLEQGLQAINQAIKDIKNTFSTVKFKQSEIATDFIQNVLERIDPEYEKLENVHKIQKIYSSIPSGLNYKQVLEKTSKEPKSNLLFIFQSSSGQKFGGCIFQQSQQPQQQQLQPFQLAPPQNLQGQLRPLTQQPTQQQQQASQPNKSLLFQLNKKQIYPISNIQNNQPFQHNLQANDNSWLLRFGNEDLQIDSTFKNCFSKLGSHYQINEYNIGNPEMNLANSVIFDITALEIFQMPTK